MTVISENTVLTNVSPIMIVTHNYYTNGLAKSVIIKMKIKGILVTLSPVGVVKDILRYHIGNLLVHRRSLFVDHSSILIAT
jgi:hypothetical protein